MSKDEFAADMERALSKLTAAEREMLEAVILGSEVNHSLVYALAAFALGCAAGWLL